MHYSRVGGAGREAGCPLGGIGSVLDPGRGGQAQCDKQQKTKENIYMSTPEAENIMGDQLWQQTDNT